MSATLLAIVFGAIGFGLCWLIGWNLDEILNWLEDRFKGKPQ